MDFFDQGLGRFMDLNAVLELKRKEIDQDLITNIRGHNDLEPSFLLYVFGDEIHANTGSNSGHILTAAVLDNFWDYGQCFLLSERDFSVYSTKEFGHFARVYHVVCIRELSLFRLSATEGMDWLRTQRLRNGTNQARIEPAR